MSDREKLFCFRNLPGSNTVNIQEFENQIRRETMIRPGLWLSVMNFSADQPMQIAFERRHTVVDFGFALSADMNKQIRAKKAGIIDQKVKSGISGIQYAGEQTGMITIHPETKQQILHIHASLPFLNTILKKETAAMPPFFENLIRKKAPGSFSHLTHITPDIQAVAYQVLNSSSHAVPWHLYLEAKALELLSLYLAALTMDHDKHGGVFLTATEKKQVLKARDILIHDLHAPPTLDELSSKTGLPPSKLQTGFRNLYGKSVFDYFREYRLQTAKLLLDKAATNVSETAWQVGYVNVSHFGAAFNKRFGILPKQYLKAVLKNQAGRS